MSFRAGLCVQTGKLVSADPRKGRVVLQEKDGALHFKWRLRYVPPPTAGGDTADATAYPLERDEIDITCDPSTNSAKLELLSECTDGRVLLLEVEY